MKRILPQYSRVVCLMVIKPRNIRRLNGLLFQLAVEGKNVFHT
jgi:hypothetical protein